MGQRRCVRYRGQASAPPGESGARRHRAEGRTVSFSWGDEGLARLFLLSFVSRRGGGLNQTDPPIGFFIRWVTISQIIHSSIKAPLSPLSAHRNGEW